MRDVTGDHVRHEAVVVLAGGREASHENLQRVWELKGSPEELRTYIAQAVRGALAKVNG